MLSIGWTEMMLVAAIALIVVGPKDLPAMLRQIGKAVGSIRRMGNDFKAELNKVTAVDDLKDIKRSIASPLTDVRRDIEKEFNSIAPDGSAIPSGKIAPADPDAQSVADEIKAAAGLDKAPVIDGSAAKASMAAAVAKAKNLGGGAAQGATTVATTAQPKLMRKPRKTRTARAKTATSKVTASKPVAIKKPASKQTGSKKPAAKKTPAKKPATKKPAKSETN